MQTKNPLFLGFTNVKHYFNTLLGIENFFIHFCFGLLLALISGLFSVTYETNMGILSLLILLGFNFFIGANLAIKKRSFSSNKLPKTLILLLSYSIILIHLWHISRNNIAFAWIPSMFYGIFFSVTIQKTLKNLCKINIIHKKTYQNIYNFHVYKKK